MSSKYNYIEKVSNVPNIITYENEAVSVNDSFLELTGYNKEEILKKNIEHILKNLLRFNGDIESLKQSNKSFFIFTKSLEPREVEIDYGTINEPNQNVYFFKEKPFSRIEESFKCIEKMCIDNLLSVSIYSVPDLILLKASQKYLDFFDPPYNTKENCIGKCIYDFVNGWKNSPSETIWREVISTGKSTIVKEQQHIGFDRGVTYWDAVIMPIFEDGKVKYISSQTTDVTERVVNRNRAEAHLNALNEKNKELQAVVDSISDDLYIIEKDGAIKTINSNAKISFNNRASNIKENYSISKYYDLSGNEIPFDEMPSSCLLRGETIKGREIRIKRGSGEKYLSVSGTPITDQEGKVQRAVYCHNDITKYILQAKTIAQQKDQLQAIIENMTDGLFMLDRNHHFTFLNQAGKEFFYQPEIIIKNGDSFKHTKYFDLEGKEIPVEDMVGSRVLRGETIKQFRMKVVRPDKVIYYSLSGSPIYDSDGNVSQAIVCCRDINEQIQQENNIREQKERLELILDNMAEGIVVFDNQGNYILQSQKVEEYGKHSTYIGRTVGRIGQSVDLGEGYYDIYGNLVSKEELPNYKVLMGEEVNNYRLMFKKAGKTFYYEYSGRPAYDDKGDFKLGILTCRDITEVIEKDKEIKKQQEYLRIITEKTSDAIMIISPDGKYSYFNDSAYKMTYQPEKLNKHGDSLVQTKYFYENGLELRKEDLPALKVFKGEVFNNVILKCERPDKIAYYSFNGRPVYDESNNIVSAILTVSDITESYQYAREIKIQKEALEASIKKIEFQAKLLDLSSEAIFAWDLDSGITYWNNGAAKMYGYSFEEAIGRISHDLLKTIHPIEIGDLISILQKDGTWFGEIEHTTKDGRKLTIESNKQVIFNELGQKTVLEINRDISERKQTEELLKQVNDKLSVALESVEAGIWEWDIATDSQVWSPKIYEFYGIDPAEPVPLEKGIGRVYPDDREDYECSLNEACKTLGEFWRKDFRIINPDRGIVWLKGTGKIIYDKAGIPIKMVGVNIDITEQKLHQQLLLQAERQRSETLENTMKMKDEFLYLITHEFKTPLAVISSAIQAIDFLCRKQMPETANKFLKTIRQNTNRQLRLVNNLLDITRINAGHIKLNQGVFDIVYITQSIVNSIQTFAQQKGISVNFTSALIKKEILIDEEKFERILLNLLSNALKFTPSGKSINVNVATKRFKNKNMVSISVQDQGIGIPKDKQGCIFERFGQADTSLSRQAEGTGIGLHLVKLFVQAMGGQITLKSKEGKGSTFTILLPSIKATPVDELTTQYEMNSKIMQRDNRLIQSVAIEFSDIYL
ncbi:MAG: PAS domain S-box protein [Clostridia bacterium]|nr:PAS domain S-box protein [Clostridia bacterium]